MGFIKDTFSIFKKNELTFLKRYKESDGVYTFIFEKEKDLTWNAGQHGLFTITHKKIKNATRPFTLASSPTEGVLQITTAINNKPSNFKKALLELETGMKISMSGPVGSFYLKDKNPSLLIAGGIGITPFRAIAKQLETEGDGDEKQVSLLYLDSNKSYIYKEELDEISKNTSIDVNYLESRDQLYEEINKYITTYKNDCNYFIAGSKSMVSSITNHLKSHNISKRNIKKDTFIGIH
ncbi:FAD-dependent oxidoreductase [Evansella halocellulosilytica]|uniref:FAD-dependent oxidoreductase n=1 Tax=Evansella halocellulosilytica TaxID=2011013 RepID=UPI000BB897C6|nr:FAD-dependent oxidoreductase [Evansella halocellulosilytica]